MLIVEWVSLVIRTVYITYNVLARDNEIGTNSYYNFQNRVNFICYVRWKFLENYNKHFKLHLFDKQLVIFNYKTFKHNIVYLSKINMQKY